MRRTSGKQSDGPSDPGTPSQRRTFWSSPALCRGFLSPLQTEGPRCPAAGTSERRAQRPPGGRRVRQCQQNYSAYSRLTSPSPTSLHNNHPGRRTTMTTAPVFSHRLFALCLSWTERVGELDVNERCRFESQQRSSINLLPPVVFSSVSSNTTRLAQAGLVWNQSVKELTNSAKNRPTAFRTVVTVTMTV